MPIAYELSGDLDNMAAIESILERFEDDVLRQQELRAWLRETVRAAEKAMEYGDCDADCDLCVEDLFYSNADRHTCDPACEGGCTDVRRQPRATRAVTIPGGGRDLDALTATLLAEAGQGDAS